MRNRRFAQVAMSDDEDDAPAKPPSPAPHSDDDHRRSKRKRKQMKLIDEEEEEQKSPSPKKKKTKQDESENEEDAEEEEEEEAVVDAKPIGEPVKSSGKGKKLRNHFETFEYDGLRYELEDAVLLVPEETNQKPYVAIIKDIMQDKEGNVMVLGQWFYRPEEAEKKGGGNWNSSDTRELFYSFHRDEVAAESVMHKCVVHFIPLNKQIPKRKEHPGFIVQRVYDTEQRKLFKLTDKDYEDSKQHEIDLLVQKTFSRLGDVPDIETEDGEANQEDQLRNKRLLRRKNMLPLDVSRVDEDPAKSGMSSQLQKAETPGSCNSNGSEYYKILANFKVLTGESQRDKWLEKLLEGIQSICTPPASSQADGKEKAETEGNNVPSEESGSAPEENSKNGKPTFLWPDAAVPAIAALEKASHETFSGVFEKYNQKMRQLSFNLKNNAQLSRRLLAGELEPIKILKMSSVELKEGLTTEEIASKEPEESAHIQMTDARCKRCMEKKVGLTEIIQAGHGDRYRLECHACGNDWWTSRDEASTLTIDGSNSRNVGTAPLATAKFEDVEKLVSPREHKKSATDLLKKTTEAKMPVLDNQRSFNKSRSEDNVAATTAES
ncbi:hypothetical protein DCAR_0100389 [Daucus carota subsp. sativus]|uniref:BAH domain-containing protein n=2 Tax=Daucus carota subsp. sativus TaxID=79200 RepID=A0AAF0W0Q4_DAUCS|nr:PREDICTED: uncharacterized protein LOC108205057 [Daucus carota subsp. sativus]WOG81244.1 hypothetical protein DCAR_0100389 [Daucus carota subsp. sativus]